MLITFSILLWIFFIIFAKVTQKLKTMEKGILQMPFLLIVILFGTFDVLYNITLGSILFLQLPHWKRATLTSRLKYILQTGTGWRSKLASFVCRKLIEPWDYNHCGLK